MLTLTQRGIFELVVLTAIDSSASALAQLACAGEYGSADRIR